MYQRAALVSLARPRSIATVGILRDRRPTYAQRVGRSQPRGLIESPAVHGVVPTLGFSLNPFTLVKKAVSVVKSVLSHSTVTVPTPVGPQAIPVSQLPDTIRGASIQVGQQPQGPLQQVGSAVESIPGGWATVAVVGIGAAVLLPMLMRRGR